MLQLMHACTVKKRDKKRDLKKHCLCRGLSTTCEKQNCYSLLKDSPALACDIKR